jgi:hypothetical protein
VWSPEDSIAIGGFFYMAANFAESVEWVYHQLTKSDLSNEDMDKLDFDTLAHIFRNIELPSLFTDDQKKRLFRVVSRYVWDIKPNELNRGFLEAAKAWYAYSKSCVASG